MSYEIVKGISIKDDKVYFNCAPSNVFPREFRSTEVPEYSEMYRNGGYEALLPDIAANIWNGNYHLYSGTTLTKHLLHSYDLLSGTANLSGFLDTDRAAKFITEMTLHHLDSKKYPEVPKLSDLDALRYHKESVLAVCEKNPQAFNYASNDIQTDRDAAKEFIKRCSDKILFRFPVYFKNDKDLAMLALANNGCIYRELSENLRSDKDIVRSAFREMESRRAHEHIPDLIPKEVRADKEFMKEIINICPSLHVERAPELLADKELALVFVRVGKFLPYNITVVPKEYLQTQEFKDVLQQRFEGNEEKYNVLRSKYMSLGIKFEPRRKPLFEQIKAAEQKQVKGSENQSRQNSRNIGNDIEH